MHIPEEAIEAAARADWTSYTEARGKEAFGDYPTFDSLPAYIQDKYRDDVRPMIEAAAPLLAPRPITTKEGLDALPEGSVILVRHGAVGQKSIEDAWVEGKCWWFAGNPTMRRIVDTDFPITLLHIPVDSPDEG